MSDNTKDYIETYYKILEEMRSGMQSVEANKNISQAFIDNMIIHHNAGKKMAENILKYTTDVEIESLAKTIIEESSQNIETLQKLRESCTNLNSERDVFLYEKGCSSAFDKMLHDMTNSPSSNNLNADFLYQMIPHHQGAIDMSKNLLKFDICEELREEVEHSIMNEQMQIDQMRNLIRKV